ncbi:hypothetical protein [Metabacillus sp. FJAT-53654]|jgi:hypothetical protein|uniref:N-formylglutamate amidohydrolase n=1 Tax=Metabacillus rhizosphaerae TaxID=3117747 RepID=A0ABZ2MRT5_9BACI
MPLKYIQQNYVKYNKGNGYICCLSDALHATPPAADVFTDNIVEGIMERTGCPGIISTVSRKLADLNRSPNGDNDLAIKEYRHALKDILEFLKIVDYDQQHLTHPFLHVSFHGMKDDHYGPYGVEIGTVRGRSCSVEIKNWFEETLTKKAKQLLPNINLIFDQKFVGNESITYHRLGDGNRYQGFGSHFHTFQIELSRTMRKEYRPQLIDIFSEIIIDFQTTCVNK